jgi:phage tail-like protein
MSAINFSAPDASPPTAFYFSVNFIGEDSIESSFQEVSGLKVTLDMVEAKDLEENSFVHRLPTPPKFENLVLKRCLVPNSKLDAWCQGAINNFKFAPRDLHISLKGAGENNILASWTVVQAFPISWELAALNATSNALAIETLTLNYRHFKREL